MFQIDVPCRILIAGASNCGKTWLLTKIVLEREKILNGKIERVLCFSKYETSLPEALRNCPIVEWRAGLPTEKDLSNTDLIPTLITIDDSMESCMGSKVVSEIFSQGRHKSLSCILITQNLFSREKYSRNIQLSSTILIVFRNIRDKSSITNLAKQCVPQSTRSFCHLFNQHVAEPYKYTIFDFNNNQLEFLRYRGRISITDCVEIFAQDEEIEKHTQRETHSEICERSFYL